MSKPWVRLYVTVEGYAERAFADATLAPQLAEFSVDLQTRIVSTNRKLGARGGGTYFATFKRDLALLMQDQSNADVKRMVRARGRLAISALHPTS